jgi:hypothetical protein
VEAVQAGRREEWLHSFFYEGYPVHISDSSVISAILLLFGEKITRTVLECESCGRLWVQIAGGRNEYRSYMPDAVGYTAILRSAVGGEG